MKAAGSIVGAIVALGGPLLAALGATVLLGACASCESTVREASIPALASAPGNGAAFDPRDRRLYVSEGGNHLIAVVDLSSAKPQVLGTIDAKHTTSALALAPDQDRLFAALSEGKVAVIDIKATSPTFRQVVATVTVAPTTAKTLDYDPKTHLLFVATGADREVISVDTKTNAIHAFYPVGLPVGQARYNSGDGKIYVAVPSADAVYQLDPNHGAISRKFLAKGCHPSALAINPNQDVALAGCRGSVGVLDLKTGDMNVTRSVPGASSITYDAASDRFAVAAPHGATDSVLGMFNGDGSFIGSVAAAPNSGAAVFDNARGLVYVPSAVGLLSLSPSACLPPPNWLKFAGSVSVFAVPLAAAALFLILYARRMDRRPKKRHSQPTYSDLKKEDLAYERERIRALEDSIYGPEVSPGP